MHPTRFRVSCLAQTSSTIVRCILLCAMSTLVMLNVNPYQFHVSKGRPPDEWISTLHGDIQTALLSEDGEPADWLPVEWCGRVATRAHAVEKNNFSGCVWMTLRHVRARSTSRGERVDPNEILRWDANQKGIGKL